MHARALSLGAAAILGSALVPNAESATLDSELKAAIAGLGPKDEVAIIVRCSDRVEPREIVASDRRSKRRKLVQALRAKGTLCQRLVAKDLAANERASARSLWAIDSVATRVAVARLETLLRRPGVERIGLDKEIRLPEAPPAPVPTGEPGNPSWTFWNLSEIRAPDLWAMGYYGQNAVVATLDTGVDPHHADLVPNWRGGANSWLDPHGEHGSPYDASGHGTQVMGILVGGRSLGVDIGAAPGARWIAAKIFDDSGASTYGKIHEAYQWLLDPDGNPDTDDAPDIVNSSWAIPQTGVCTGEFADDLAWLRAAGIAVVSSAGNLGPAPGSSVEPANNPGTLSVGATDYYRDPLYSSSRGPSACDESIFPSLVAPGRDIFTTDLTGHGANPSAWAYVTGTSIAAPHVAGALAILKSAFPDADLAELEAALREGAVDLGDAGPDNATGAGYLDLVSAYYLLAGNGVSDADSDGVSDGEDLCPATPSGEPADNSGCSASQRDADSDGYTADADCNDSSATAYPGAPEVQGDGIDQDCNGLDLTISIGLARYVAAKDQLVIQATSALGAQAGLRTTIALLNGKKVDRPLNWSSQQGRWQKTFTGFVASFRSAPVSVTVYGAEGAASAPVQQR